MLRIIGLAFERPVRSISNIAEALGVTYAGAGNNVNELIGQGVAEEVAGTYPKLIRFPGYWRRRGWGDRSTVIAFPVPSIIDTRGESPTVMIG